MACDLVIRIYYIIFIHGKKGLELGVFQVTNVKPGQRQKNCVICRLSFLRNCWKTDWGHEEKQMISTEEIKFILVLVGMHGVTFRHASLFQLSVWAEWAVWYHTVMAHTQVCLPVLMFWSVFLQVLIAAFAASGYASTYFRAGSKPFNPVLGETYECIREDKGFRFFSEQVNLVFR